MKLKPILLALGLSAGLVSGLFAKGETQLGALGVNYSFFSSYTDGIGLTGVFGHQNRPFQATINWSFANARVGATADWVFLRQPLPSSQLWYFLGIGAGVGIGKTFDLGARLPLGIQFFPLHSVELYAEAAPGLKVLSSFGFDFGLTVGLRYHFGL